MKRITFTIVFVILLVIPSLGQQQNILYERITGLPALNLIESMGNGFSNIWGDELYKEFSTSLKKNDPNILNNFFKRMENDLPEKKKKKIIKRRPATYYLMMGFAAHRANDTLTAFYSYSLFLHVWDNYEMEKQDKRFLKKLKGFDLRSWVNTARFFNAYVYQQNINLNVIIADMEAEKRQLENDQKKAEDEIILLKDTIAKYDLKVINIKENIKGNISIFEKDINGNIVTYSNDWLSTNTGAMSKEITSTIGNYEIGCYNDDAIQSCINNVYLAIKKQKEMDVRIDGNDIEVTLTITGKADSRGRGQRVGTYYSNQEFLGLFSKQFELIDGWEGNNRVNGTKMFNISRELNYKYYNYELAFLRAYIAFKLLKNNLENNLGINVLSGVIKAIEYNSRADSCRGIEVEIVIEGLFKHYEREITKLKGQIIEMQERINYLENKIKELKEQQDRLKEIIEQTDAEKKHLDNIKK